MIIKHLDYHEQKYKYKRGFFGLRLVRGGLAPLLRGGIGRVVAGYGWTSWETYVTDNAVNNVGCW